MSSTSAGHATFHSGCHKGLPIKATFIDDQDVVCALIGHRLAGESAFFTCRCEACAQTFVCMYIHIPTYVAVQNFVSIRRELRRSFCRVHIHNMCPAREPALKISSFHRECPRRGPQKAVESYGWYASRARNTRRTRGPTSCWSAARYRHCTIPFAANQRERERKGRGVRRERNACNLCAARSCVCTPVFTRDTSRENAVRNTRQNLPNASRSETACQGLNWSRDGQCCAFGAETLAGESSSLEGWDRCDTICNKNHWASTVTCMPTLRWSFCHACQTQVGWNETVRFRDRFL